jgi:hypothetical protein
MNFKNVLTTLNEGMEPEFKSKLELFLEIINKLRQDNDTTRKEHGREYLFPLTYKDSRKFIKVLANNGGQTSVYCFIEKETGIILKPASFSQPAKGSRGNIFDPEKYEKRANNSNLIYSFS